MRWFVCTDAFEASQLLRYLEHTHNINAIRDLRYIGITDEEASLLLLAYDGKPGIMSAVRKWTGYE